ncbi:MAG: hypothetical protein R3324_02555 [Halobacteriales archaeon]|nr:hypothetical protein [Halobacteriales archaeon]
MEHVRTYRGINVRAAVHYLEQVGGSAVAEDRVQGDGWEATLSEETVQVGPTLTLTEVTVNFSGEADVLDTLIDAFSQKAIRAGG